ncbi:glycoside hydrolase family 76 protein [Microlunatus soli]|uniref:Glycosyl hydrolase family 76 n=1 Tax=Microlunatus soli TaxID=630515 RepID=A0A1H1XSI7_9ACTN|nr:glycoside hydrolase family 76 protein [Microlunatus soli]SDT12163.1 Glycosyl hydrolase family 76 [Microlunatus soli]
MMIGKHRPHRLRNGVIGLIALLVGLVPATTAVTARADVPEDSGATATARARVAADVLMGSYEPVKAWFPSSWWNSAVALQTIGDYMQRTGDRRYLPQLDNTFEKDKGVFPPGYLSGDPLLGNFTSRAIDDSEWWGLTWIQAYDLTGDRKYLDMAVTIAEFVNDYWDDTCGGGVWWNGERTYKNAVTNGLWIRLTAELHNRIDGDTQWLKKSRAGWDWLMDSGMINSDGLVNDGLNDDCTSNGQTVYSYNQGLAIGAGLELWRATGDDQLLATSRRLADAALTSSELTTDGILTESCDVADRSCDDNGKQFKGIFMRYVMDLADTTHADRYEAFVQRQADSIWTTDRDAADRLGERWAGGAGDGEHPNAFDWRTQASALSALIAAVPEPAPTRSLAATMDPAQPVVMPAATGATRIKINLGVSGTAAGKRPMQVTADVTGPKGWQITPKSSSVALRTDGSRTPAYGSIAVDVTVPADAADGHHTVRATVTADPRLTFTAEADVLVAHSIDFDTGTAAEDPWLYDADGSQSSGPQNRFADGNSYFVYRFPLPADTKAATAKLTIDNEYTVQAGPDGTDWTTVLKETEQIHDGQNKATHEIDLAPYLGTDKAVYLKVSDSFPDDGWGGRLSHLSVDITGAG